MASQWAGSFPPRPHDPDPTTPTPRPRAEGRAEGMRTHRSLPRAPAGPSPRQAAPARPGAPPPLAVTSRPLEPRPPPAPWPPPAPRPPGPPSSNTPAPPVRRRAPRSALRACAPGAIRMRCTLVPPLAGGEAGSEAGPRQRAGPRPGLEALCAECARARSCPLGRSGGLRATLGIYSPRCILSRFANPGPAPPASLPVG